VRGDCAAACFEEKLNFTHGTIVPSFALQVRKDWPVVKGRKKSATLEQAFGQVIIRYREKLGLSQMDLAVATGYSLRYVGDLERGTKSATLRTMNDLATLYKISLGSLLSEAEAILGGKERQDKTLVTGKERSSRRRD
jgi:ribosome-binding protein aMBF1 (putative translation factor)